jgi:hypothetical protein
MFLKNLKTISLLLAIVYLIESSNAGIYCSFEILCEYLSNPTNIYSNKNLAK